ITTNEIVGAHRTRLSLAGDKIDRRMLGIADGAAVKLDPDDAVTVMLGVGEGIETCLAARQLGIRPGWALLSSGCSERFQVLGGIETLMILAERCSASGKAVGKCGPRWHAAGREVITVEPTIGKDINDAIQGAPE